MSAHVLLNLLNELGKRSKMRGLRLKFSVNLSQTYKDMTLYPHMNQNVYGDLLQKNFSIQESPLYKRL